MRSHLQWYLRKMEAGPKIANIKPQQTTLKQCNSEHED